MVIGVQNKLTFGMDRFDNSEVFLNIVKGLIILKFIIKKINAEWILYND